MVWLIIDNRTIVVVGVSSNPLIVAIGELVRGVDIEIGAVRGVASDYRMGVFKGVASDYRMGMVRVVSNDYRWRVVIGLVFGDHD